MKKFIFLVIIPTPLIIFWIVCSLFFNSAISFSVLVYQQPKTDIKQLPLHKLLKGEKIVGEFQAKENHLGIIQLKFNNYVKYNYAGEDVFSFAIKEKGNKNWYSIGYYRSGLLEHNLLFPFGFTAIENSKGKTYDFEITSLYGNDANAIEIDKTNPTLLTGYQIPKREILASKRTAFTFLTKKFITSFTNTDFLLSSSIYLIPLFLYILVFFAFMWGRRNFLIYPLPILSLLLILLDIFLLKQMYLGLQVLLVLFWIYCVIKSKISSKVTFSFAFLLILIWLSVLLFRVNDFQSKINFWAYCFLFIGSITALCEEGSKKKNETV